MRFSGCLLVVSLFGALSSGTFAQTCSGNGFVGGCSDIYSRTGVPTGFSELVAYDPVNMVTDICEGDRIAVVHDCYNRVPLYVSVTLDRAQIDASNPGRCGGCDFRPSTELDVSFQAVDDDYSSANSRSPCYERQSDNELYRDQFWLDNASSDQQCFSSEPRTGTSRGHMIADNFIRLPDSDKDATYHFTNCIPQYQKFNNEAWNIAEQRLNSWGEFQCGDGISDPTLRNNAVMHIIVGSVPSSNVTQVFDEPFVEPRWFGEFGFGDGDFQATIDYSGNTVSGGSNYRVNMPAAMWTAGCCVALDANNNVGYVRHTSYGRHARPIGNDNPVVEAPWNEMISQMLPGKDTSGVNLFPNEPMCSDPANYVAIGI